MIKGSIHLEDRTVIYVPDIRALKRGKQTLTGVEGEIALEWNVCVT